MEKDFGKEIKKKEGKKKKRRERKEKVKDRQRPSTRKRKRGEGGRKFVKTVNPTDVGCTVMKLRKRR